MVCLDLMDHQDHQVPLVHPALVDLTENQDQKVRVENRANQDWPAWMVQKDLAVTLVNLDALE